MAKDISFLLASFVMTLFFSCLMLKYVHLRGFMDVPDDRKIHVKSVPRFGGIPFSLVVLVCFMYFLIIFSPYKITVTR